MAERLAQLQRDPKGHGFNSSSKFYKKLQIHITQVSLDALEKVQNSNTERGDNLAHCMGTK